MRIVFTKHAKERMVRRRIFSIEVIECLKFPDRAIKKYGKYYFQKQLFRGTLEVCCEKTERNINVITTYWL